MCTVWVGLSEVFWFFDITQCFEIWRNKIDPVGLGFVMLKFVLAGHVVRTHRLAIYLSERMIEYSV